MLYFSESKALLSLLLFNLALAGCTPGRAPGPERNMVGNLDSDVFYNPVESESEKYVDYLSNAVTACDWQKYLEKNFSSKSTGRYRLLGSVEKRARPPNYLNPLSIVEQWLGVVDLILPWNKFGDIEIPDYRIRPWGRVDMKAHTLNSFSILNVAEKEIPDRKEFVSLATIVLAKRPTQYLKLVAFRLGLITGTINAISKRNEFAEVELEKVYPGLFSENKKQDLLESLSWILLKNGLREKGSNFELESLEVFSRKLPVFRSGGWNAFSEDMKIGLGAAMNGYRSKSVRERACAANIIMRSADQMLHLIGQETIPLSETADQQSYSPTFEGFLKTRDATEFRRCSSPGSILRSGSRIRIGENALTRLSSVAGRYSWTDKPYPLSYCKPTETNPRSLGISAPAPGASAFDAVLARLEAFGHYLFALNPGSTWWKSGDVVYPLGSFDSMKEIQKSGTISPEKIHTLSLALLQFNLLHLESRHLVFVDPDGIQTDQDNAQGIRLSSDNLGPSSVIAKTDLASAIRWLELLSKFDRYLRSIETWSLSPQATPKKIKSLFASRENLNMLIGPDGENRKKIGKLYLATSLLLLKFVDRENPGECHRQIVTELRTGKEELLGDCSELRPALAASLRKLSMKLQSTLLQRSADALDATIEP